MEVETSVPMVGTRVEYTLMVRQTNLNTKSKSYKPQPFFGTIVDRYTDTVTINGGTPNEQEIPMTFYKIQSQGKERFYDHVHPKDVMSNADNVLLPEDFD